jgi:hypothetical protein
LQTSLVKKKKEGGEVASKVQIFQCAKTFALGGGNLIKTTQRLVIWWGTGMKPMPNGQVREETKHRTLRKTEILFFSYLFQVPMW